MTGRSKAKNGGVGSDEVTMLVQPTVVKPFDEA